MPRRRAGSPVHASIGPSTPNFTPAMCSSSATALVVFLARSSRAPAQPTQNRYSRSSGTFSSMSRTSIGSTSREASSSIHSARFVSGTPHGLPLFSRFLSMTPASEGKFDSIMTW